MSISDYSKFLSAKSIISNHSGITEMPPLNNNLFPFQEKIVAWALRKGRAAIFADCGMGKTLMQLEWARVVAGQAGPVLILAPLAVAQQTVKEGAKFGIDVYYERKHPKVERGITITNYEMLQHFDLRRFQGIVLDESSILKSYDGKTRTQIIEGFANTPYKLACTATPAPNDYMELGNHSEFLNVLTRSEMLSTFFVHDGGETQKWRLKKHAANDFWRWVSSWAISIRHPSDLGYDDGDFILPKLSIEQIVVKTDAPPQGMLFSLPAVTLDERRSARRDSTENRAKVAAEMVAKEPNVPWLIWCDLNVESDLITKLIPGAKQIKGSDSIEYRESVLTDYANGDLNVLVTKPSIAGFGLNWQHCSRMIFLGLSDSYEQVYQAIRRCWRFGQKKQVNVYFVISDLEGNVAKNIKRKETESNKMAEEMNHHILDALGGTLECKSIKTSTYNQKVVEDRKYKAILGDCVECTKLIEDDSIDFSIFSPPFASLYTYSASDRDMGNCRNHDEFFQHLSYLIDELYRVLKPGRLISFHCMNLPTSKSRDGVIGLTDFRGELIRSFTSKGFIYHSEVVIWKDPVTAMQRTKAIGLLHKQLKKDSTISRQGIPDYLVTVRKPGENKERVTHTNESFPVGLWQKYASPVWMDINPSKTLQHRSAREHEDERHICPLQLDVIERALMLWTNPNDLILSPFMGIGSEGVISLEMGRRFIGIELKESYYKQAVKNLSIAQYAKAQSLFTEESEDAFCAEALV